MSLKYRSRLAKVYPFSPCSNIWSLHRYKQSNSANYLVKIPALKFPDSELMVLGAIWVLTISPKFKSK